MKNTDKFLAREIVLAKRIQGLLIDRVPHSLIEGKLNDLIYLLDKAREKYNA